MNEKVHVKVTTSCCNKDVEIVVEAYLKNPVVICKECKKE